VTTETREALDSTQAFSLSQLLIALMKGPIYADKHAPLWESLLSGSCRAEAVDYLKVLGLQLYVDDAEGYAFLRQDPFEDEPNPPPRLIQRRSLSFPVSVLCLTLRQWLLEHDTRGGEVRAIIERRQIRDEMALFVPQTGSEAKFDEAIDRYIRRSEELGLLKPLKDDPQRFEIQRITKALVNAEWLGDLSARLEEYKAHADSIG